MKGHKSAEIVSVFKVLIKACETIHRTDFQQEQ